MNLLQKPETSAPSVGDTLHGYTYTQKSKGGDFLKFKKVNPEYDQGSGGGSKPQPANNDYVIELLEAIAVAVGAEVKKADVVPSEFEGSQPIDLSEIPF